MVRDVDEFGDEILPEEGNRGCAFCGVSLGRFAGPYCAHCQQLVEWEDDEWFEE